MADFDDTNTWVLFRNERKEKENQPDYTGNINIEGEEFRLAAWVKTSKQGKKFFSGRVSPKDDGYKPAATKPRGNPSPPPADDFDSDIPF